MFLINITGTKRCCWLTGLVFCFLIRAGHGILDPVTLSGTQFFYGNGDQFFVKGTASLFCGDIYKRDTY